MAVKLYLSADEYAKLHNLNSQRIRMLLRQRRIPGVIITPKMYLIPEDAPLPPARDMSQFEYRQANYISASAAARKNGISINRVRALRQLGLIEGIIQVGKYQMIPEDWVPPQDRRIKSQKYIGWRNKHGKKDSEHSDDL
ncbi:MAG: hypothetical protein IJA20_08260 [Methanocorpusculum sp.]|nr:hypothetical protein [Oscillospiraceae bacterium]MBQ3570645.1 hypothetical protein [Methanocorpusculum sp.]